MQKFCRLAWYRFRATFRHEWSGYLTILLLIGFTGGLAMTAVAAARRTQSSFPTLVARSDPSDLRVIDNSGDPGVLRTLAALPHVNHVATTRLVDVQVLGANGAPAHASLTSSGVYAVGGTDGLYFAQDRVVITAGRMADRHRADEMVMSGDAARVTGLRVGDLVPVAVYTDAQAQDPNAGSTNVTPYRRANVKLVGIAVFNNALVRDDIDRFPAFVLFTPAFSRDLAACCSSGKIIGLQLAHGTRDIPEVESAIGKRLPGVSILSVTSAVVAKAQRAIRPEVIALEVFGAIAGFATLLIVGQVIGRQGRARREDRAVLRSVGASPSMVVSDGLVGTLIAVTAGAFVATFVAVALSPLAPIGPVRSVDHSPGIKIDWTVFGFGALALLVVLSALAVALANRESPHRVARRTEAEGGHGSRVARAAAASGMPFPMVTGLRFALEPGTGRSTVPVRSAILGAALAVIVVVATVTFGASLDTLVSRPALYGWNWDYEMVGAYGGISNIPQTGLDAQLGRDRDVEAWSGAYIVIAQIDGHAVPSLATQPSARVAPPTLSGHGLDRTDQIVLGASTLAALHKQVGDTVEVSGVSPQPTRLRVVGTATMPAIGVFGSFHLEMGSGAVLADSLLPKAAKGFGDHDGPEAVFVCLRRGANPTTARRKLEQVATALNTPGDGLASVVSVQRPAEIINYQSQQATPVYLGLGLAAGATTALALTLRASVRRRRHDLAVLKMLGFSRRQLAAAVAWQSTVAVAIGTLIGVPVGLVVGRFLWDLFAHGIHVVPEPTTPLLTISLVAIGALLLANIVAVLPAQRAARTPTAFLLRAE